MRIRQAPRRHLISLGLDLEIDHGDRIMTNPIPMARAQLGLRLALAASVALFLNAPLAANAQVIEGVQKGAKEGNKAAGPVGGVLGGAIGGVVGVFTGVLGAGQQPAPATPPAANGAKQAGSTKAAKGAK